MKPLRWSTLAIVAACAAAVTYAVVSFTLRAGGAPFPMHPAVSLVVVVGALVLLRLGWSVRRLVRHQPTRMTHLGAVRVACAAQAARILAAIICGRALVRLLVSLARIEAATLSSIALDAAVALVAAVILLVAGTVVERWCIVGGDDEDDGKGTAAGGAQPRPV